MSKKREIGTVVNCFVCDSFFFFVITTVPPPSHFSGRKGTREYEDFLERIQIRFFGSDSPIYEVSYEDEIWKEMQIEAFLSTPSNSSANCDQHKVSTLKKKKKKSSPLLLKKTYQPRSTTPDRKVHLLPCYTCAKCKLTASSLFDQTDTMSISTAEPGQEDTVFSPCTYYTFVDEQFPPLYSDANNSNITGKKPKWTLVSGVGPKVLELDSSKSGRIYKPSLRSFIGDTRCVPFDRWAESEWPADNTKESTVSSREWEVVFADRHQYLTQFWENVLLCDKCGENRRALDSCTVSESELCECELHCDYWNGIFAPSQQIITVPHFRNTAISRISWLTSVEYQECYSMLCSFQPGCRQSYFMALQSFFNNFI